MLWHKALRIHRNKQQVLVCNTIKLIYFVVQKSLSITVCTKAATDPKNWIRDPVGTDPDPDPLTNGAIFH